MGVAGVTGSLRGDKGPRTDQTHGSNAKLTRNNQGHWPRFERPLRNIEELSPIQLKLLLVIAVTGGGIKPSQTTLNGSP